MICNSITRLADPTRHRDAVHKAHVDTEILSRHGDKMVGGPTNEWVFISGSAVSSTTSSIILHVIDTKLIRTGMWLSATGDV